MVKLSHLWKMNMSKPSLAQGSLFTMEELNGCLYENIQDFSGSAKLRLFLSPYLKKMFCRVELPVLWVFANAICKYFSIKRNTNPIPSYLFPREALSIVLLDSGLGGRLSLQTCQLPVASLQVAQLTVEYQ